MIRILLLCLAIGLAAACDGGHGDAAREGGPERFDTAAGFRLGMLVPEAVEAAAARGDTLECGRELDRYGSAALPDSAVRTLRDLETCDPPHERYRLHFYRGSLQSIVVPYSRAWDRVPRDTLVARLSARWGEPGGREEYAYEDGRREVLVYGLRRGAPGEVNLRCPRESPTGDCTLVYHRGKLKP